MLKALIEGFTGKGAQRAFDKTRAEQTAAAGRAREGRAGAYNTFGTQARADLGGGWDRVQGIYNPVLNGPTEASDRQYALLRGDQGAFDQYMNNPMQAALASETARRLERYGNARGQSFATSAGNALANRGMLENYNTYYGQNAALGAEERGRADSARSALANYGYGYGRDLAGVEGQKAAGIADAYGQEGAMVNNAWGDWGKGTAANANTMFQNILGLGGLALKTTGWGGWGTPANNKLG